MSSKRFALDPSSKVINTVGVSISVNPLTSTTTNANAAFLKFDACEQTILLFKILVWWYYAIWPYSLACMSGNDPKS